MYSFDEHYVEEFWLEENGLESTVKQIKSRLDYLENLDNNPFLILFRFFDRKIIIYNGNEYTSERTNYSDFIKNYNLGEFEGYTINDLLNQTIWSKDVSYNTCKIDNIVSNLDYKKILKKNKREL